MSTETTALSEQSIELVVGLGNPGSGYQATRHNVGFWFVERLAAQQQLEFHSESRFHGHVAVMTAHGQRCYLLKPHTYMNRSGQSVGALARFYKIPMDRVLVVHDELDLAPGTVRLKRGGGHGGHNGLRDIGIACGGEANFLRLRFGIGHPGNRDEVVKYVLGRPDEADRAALDGAITRALDVLPDILEGNVERAMNTLHTQP
ncbi:MAG: aminoacyl-tRNA hydrolase [Gammaproteobacteria bacterium]|nr:aminoacyl-tRNA hydrolase [Gammaproteobacteria bacterium]